MIYDTSSLIFLSTLSLRRATPGLSGPAISVIISIHALLAESDFRFSVFDFLDLPFLSTLSLRRATLQRLLYVANSYISIHALLAESDPHVCQLVLWVLRFLSTLSLRRATLTIDYCKSTISHFYPRSPCGERPLASGINPDQSGFLSTLSLRRATVRHRSSPRLKKYFYPRSPCGERLHYDNYNLHCVEISIHALLAESDMIREPTAGRDNKFLSTLSLRRATNL